MNERITENLVRDALHALGYYSAEETIIEEQKSQIAEVARLLKTGSKSGAGGRGCPEFIISSPSTPDFLIIVECKAGAKQHESPTRTKPIEFAVDGVVHYSVTNLIPEASSVPVAEDLSNIPTDLNEYLAQLEEAEDV